MAHKRLSVGKVNQVGKASVYPLLLYIYYQNTQQKTEQRKHGKQGGGEDNNTVCGTMQPKAMRSHTPHVHKVHMHVPKTQRYQTERPEFRERDSKPS